MQDLSSNVPADGIPGHIQDKSTKMIWSLSEEYFIYHLVSTMFVRTRFSPFFPPTYFCSFNLFLFHNCPNVHIGIVELHPLFQNLGLKRKVPNVYVFCTLKGSGKASVCKLSSLEKGEGVVRFFWNGLPHKPGIHQTTFCSMKSYWIILNLNFLQSQFVCLCLCILKVLYCVQVGWVSPRTGLPSFLPSSLQPPVLDTACYKALPSA